MQWIFHWSQVHSRECNASLPSGQIKKPIPPAVPDPYPFRCSISELWYQISVLWTCKTVYDDINFLMTHLLNHPGPSESHRRSGYLEHSDDALHRRDDGGWVYLGCLTQLWSYFYRATCSTVWKTDLSRLHVYKKVRRTLPGKVTFDEQPEHNTRP